MAHTHKNFNVWTNEHKSIDNITSDLIYKSYFLKKYNKMKLGYTCWMFFEVIVIISA